MSNTMARGFCAARPSISVAYTSRGQGKRPAPIFSCAIVARLFSSMFTTTMSGSGASAVAWCLTKASSSRFSIGFRTSKKKNSNAATARTTAKSRLTA
jgi:hypothetical protein